MNEKRLVDSTLSDIETVVENVFKKHFHPNTPTEEKYPKYLTRKEAASRLRISLVSLNRYTQSGMIPALTIGGRVLYEPSKIDSALSELNVKNPQS